MSFIPRRTLTYEDGKTLQSAKDQCDINRILDRAKRSGTLSHLQTHGGVYADFTDFDFTAAQNMLAQGRSIFEELPAELRKEFGNDPAQFFEYVNDPENADRLPELLPDLARPGRQFPDVGPRWGERPSPGGPRPATPPGPPEAATAPVDDPAEPSE